MEDWTMTAGDAFAIMNDEGALKLGTDGIEGICDVIEEENSQAMDMLEHLHAAGRMSMRMAKKWAERLELEDFVSYLLKKGAIGFAEALHFFVTEYDPTVLDLVNFLSERRGDGDHSSGASPYRLYRECRAAEAAAAGRAAVAGGGEQKNGGLSKDDSAKEEGFRHGKGRTKVDQKQRQ